jgi:hypothetical protein
MARISWFGGVFLSTTCRAGMAKRALTAGLPRKNSTRARKRRLPDSHTIFLHRKMQLHHARSEILTAADEDVFLVVWDCQRCKKPAGAPL